MSTIRWGIIGSGMISEWFVSDLSLNITENKHIVVAIGSSSEEKGTRFAKEYLKFNHGVKPVIQSYAEVYENPAVDVVYIGLPHSMHKDACLAALRANKHVLCEKPFTVNAKEAREVYEEAEKRHLFVMEGMWTKFFPLVDELRRQLFDERKLGQVHRLFVNFSEDLGLEKLGPESRLKNPAFGAGALLDLGVYALTYARILLQKDYEGAKFEIQAVSDVRDGIDYSTSMLVQFEPEVAGGVSRQAVLSASMCVSAPKDYARIDGELGSVVLYSHKNNAASPERFVVKYRDESKPDEVYEFDHPGYGFYYEADYVAGVLARGEWEPVKHSHKESLVVLDTMDEVRRRVGVVYPSDSK